MEKYPSSFLYKSIAGHYWPVRVADGPIIARYRFIKNAIWEIWLSIPHLTDTVGIAQRCFSPLSLVWMCVCDDGDIAGGLENGARAGDIYKKTNDYLHS